MKNTTRILIAVLALLMMLGAVACGDTGAGDVTTAAPAQTDAQTDRTHDANGYLLDDIPDTLDYNQTEVSVLYWKDVERPEFEILQEDLDGNLIEEKIFARNANIENRLGVKLVWHGEDGNSGNRAAFTSYVVNCNTNSEIYDIIATYSRTSGMLALKGLLVDLNSIDNSVLDFEKPWWPKTMLETCEIGDSLFFVSGDISLNVLHFMYAIYYNAKMIADLQLTDPVEFVQNKTWTIDKLIEMSGSIYSDLDSNSKQSDGDRYGFCTIYYHCDAFYTGSGLRLIDHHDENLLVLSPDFSGEKCINLVDKLGAWMQKDDCYVSRSGNAVNYYYPFVNGEALFCQNRVYMADDQYGSDNGHVLRDVTWTYGLVPTPLYDLDQADYITVVGNPFTLYGIMTGAKDLAMSAAVLECWASEGYRNTTPALFETNMKYKYAKEEKYSQMFDIIHDTINFDLGRIFSDSLSYMSEFPSKAATNGVSWASSVTTYKNMLTRQVKVMVESLNKAMGN